MSDFKTTWFTGAVAIVVGATLMGLFLSTDCKHPPRVSGDKVDVSLRSSLHGKPTFSITKYEDDQVYLYVGEESRRLQFARSIDVDKIADMRVIDCHGEGGLLCTIIFKEVGENSAKFWCGMIGDSSVVGGFGNNRRFTDKGVEEVTNENSEILPVDLVLCGEGGRSSRFIAASNELYTLVIVTGESSGHYVRRGNIFVCEYEHGATNSRLGKYVTEYVEPNSRPLE